MGELSNTLKNKRFELLSSTKDTNFDIYAYENFNSVIVIYHHKKIWGIPIDKIDIIVWRKLKKEEIINIPLQLIFQKTCDNLLDVVNVLNWLEI